MATSDHQALADLQVRPDDLVVQRAGRVLLLLEVARSSNLKKPLDIERLCHYDFFAANPFALFPPGEDAANAILLAGFSADDLSYQSSGHRFVTRRGRLQSDVAFLVSRGLAQSAIQGRRVAYGLTDVGVEIAAQFVSLYAHAYRASARHVLRHLDKFSDTALLAEARKRLEATGQLIDLYSVDVGESGG